MSAIPTGVILEAVNRGEATLPALKRATGFDYPVLLQALEGDLSMAVHREETATGALRFYPLHDKPSPFSTVERIPVGPLCIKCRVECKKTHQAGDMSPEARWMCPKCKERFPGTHAKVNAMVKVSDFSAADHRLNEIIAAGQKPVSDEAILENPRTEAEDLCGCGKARNHRGICGKRISAVKPDPEEAAPRLCAECGVKEAEGGTLCWDCDVAKIEAGLAEVEVAPAPVETEPLPSPVGDDAVKGGLAAVLDLPNWTGLGGLTEAKCSAPVTIDGGLRMNISINIDPAEMVKWGSLRLSNFWEGLAKALRAVNGE